MTSPALVGRWLVAGWSLQAPGIGYTMHSIYASNYPTTAYALEFS